MSEVPKFLIKLALFSSENHVEIEQFKVIIYLMGRLSPVHIPLCILIKKSPSAFDGLIEGIQRKEAVA